MSATRHGCDPPARVPCEPGAVTWITGLSAVGKTTLATYLVGRLRDAGIAAVLLDGNVIRDALEHDLGYSLEDRRRCARRYARLARMLAEQGLHVAVATISMFEEIRRWNRDHQPRYLEIYVRAPVPERRRRAARGHHEEGEARAGALDDDPAFEEPRAPDLVLDNDGPTVLDEVAARLWERVRRHLRLDAD